MNRNQKIAIGCGAVGCLGLVVVVFAGALLYWLSNRRSTTYVSNTNYNSPYNLNSNQNDNRNDSDSAAAMSDDDKHRLFQAAGMTKDSDLILRVLKKLGLMSELGVPSAGYQQFMEDHGDWAKDNYTFIRSVL